MFEPIKAPLSQAETLAKLDHYSALEPVSTRRTFLGSTVYEYSDGTKISLFNELQCSIWDPKTKRWGYTSREMAQKFAAILNRTKL